MSKEIDVVDDFGSGAGDVGDETGKCTELSVMRAGAFTVLSLNRSSYTGPGEGVGSKAVTAVSIVRDTLLLMRFRIAFKRTISRFLIKRYTGVSQSSIKC